MTEFLPPEALVAENEEKTMDMRINTWSHHEYIKPIMFRMFAAAAQRAMELRAPMIDDIEAAGIEKYYYQYATLGDGRTVVLRNLLQFPLYRAELPVERNGLPEGWDISREYAVDLRVGGRKLGFDTDDDLELAMRSSGYDDGGYAGQAAFQHALQKEAVPEEVKLSEKITTNLIAPVRTDGTYGGSSSQTVSIDNYNLNSMAWIPNLSKLGRPDVELPQKIDISFSYDTSYGNKRGGINVYGGYYNGSAKAECAQKLARLAELASRFLDMEAEAGEPASLKAIASASQQPVL